MTALGGCSKQRKMPQRSAIPRRSYMVRECASLNTTYSANGPPLERIIDIVEGWQANVLLEPVASERSWLHMIRIYSIWGTHHSNDRRTAEALFSK